jgi:L-fucose mutarotase
MLKGLDSLLTPDHLLCVLAQMGHGDEIALVDCNFPAASVAQRLVRLDGCDLATAARAMLSVLPLDTFTARPLAAMDVVDGPGVVPEVQQEIFAIARNAEGRRRRRRASRALRILRARPPGIRSCGYERGTSLRLCSLSKASSSDEICSRDRLGTR